MKFASSQANRRAPAIRAASRYDSNVAHVEAARVPNHCAFSLRPPAQRLASRRFEYVSKARIRGNVATRSARQRGSTIPVRAKWVPLGAQFGGQAQIELGRVLVAVGEQHVVGDLGGTLLAAPDA
jgi:hypothetical protein